jgi:hypothetical protein
MKTDYRRLKVIICRLFGLKNRLCNRLFDEKVDYFSQPQQCVNQEVPGSIPVVGPTHEV